MSMYHVVLYHDDVIYHIQFIQYLYIISHCLHSEDSQNSVDNIPNDIPTEPPPNVDLSVSGLSKLHHPHYPPSPTNKEPT